MPFDPALPVNGSQVLSAELRAQFTALKALIDAQAATIAALQTQVTTGLASRPTFSEMYNQSAAYMNAVDTYNNDPQDPPTFDDYVALRDRLNALIGTLWR